MSRTFFLYGVLLPALHLLGHPSWAQDGHRLQAATQCAAQTSRLERLHCYDALFRSEPTMHDTEDPRPAHWYRVQTMEQNRRDDFSLRVKQRDSGDVLMTAAALGTTQPRPRLAISCEDTITRFQLHLDTPLAEGRTRLRLNTEHTRIEQDWRIRDGGYVISGGRGLPAIDTLRQLLASETLMLGSDISLLDGLRFDLSGLRTRIAPLRAACHW